MRRRLTAPRETGQGDVDEGYGMAPDAFRRRRNVAQHEEVGAACAVCRDGLKVIGVRDRVRALPWEHDTPYELVRGGHEGRTGPTVAPRVGASPVRIVPGPSDAAVRQR